MAANKTILLVEDEDDVLQAMHSFLKSRGYHILTATDGNMGLSVAERKAPDLIIVDMIIPYKSGFLVLQKLKSRPSGPPVIMITANEDRRHRAYAKVLGADGYIRKPFAMEHLAGCIERLCPLVERFQPAGCHEA